MTSMLDYIKWRGDLGFDKSPFCEVDNLVLSDFSYIDFTDIVSQSGASIPLGEAVAAYLKDRDTESIKLGAMIPAEIVEMAGMMAKSRRYGSVRLSFYENQIDEASKIQFSAITCDIGDGSVCVVYRGTDDTIVGWKESFSLGFDRPIPAQVRAVGYLRTVALSTYAPLRLMGHSKGGNLAVYAAAFSSEETQARILNVYNDDGPGFGQDIRNSEGYGRIRGKILTFVPQSSVVGMLLEHEDDYKVVKSRQMGILQHNAFNWEVEGPAFVHLSDISGGGHLVDAALKTWLGEMSQEQREKFVDALFSLFESTGAKTLTELNQPKYAGALVKTLQHLDKETKDVLTQTFGLLFKASARSFGWRSSKKALAKGQ